MKIKFLLILLFAATFTLGAQNARTILDNANKAYNNAGGITTSFTINTEEVKEKVTYSVDGQAFMKGNKFKIDVPDGTTWFDGTTQWVYSKGSNEVNISNPTGEELAGISPAVLLNIYKTGFKLEYKGETRENSKTVYVVEMIPESPKSEYSKMSINIDKTTNLFTSIKLFGKNNINNHLIIRNLQTKTNPSDNTFVFNKKDYPKVEVIDLR